MKNKSRQETEKKRKPPVPTLPRFYNTDFTGGGEWKYFQDLPPIQADYLAKTPVRVFQNIKLHIRDLSDIGCCPETTEEKDQLLERFYKTFFKGANNG
jgi:hypothetical protein